MITILLAAVVAVDSATLCVRDAERNVPLFDAQAVDSTGVLRLLPAACNRLPFGTYQIRRIAYRAARVTLDRAATISVMLVPASASGSATRIASLEVRADAGGQDMAAERALARTSGTVEVSDAQQMGVGNVTGLIGTLPFVAPRSARGETGLSLRGARREGVAITLDGLPLNDPATGLADVSDLPLLMLGSATVALGSDPLGAGSGATGGVLALHTGARRAFSLRSGAFGQRAAEAAWQGSARGRVLYGAAGYRTARNDFPFENEVASELSGSPATEHRVNNDERRAVAAVGSVGSTMQHLLIASVGERGMVGAANVRTYDSDRTRTTRVLARTQAGVAGMRLVGGVRALELAYRDPTRPVLDSRSRAGAADVELRGRSDRGAFRGIVWRAGAGADHVTDGDVLEQSRVRGFVALSKPFHSTRTRFDIGARADGVGGLGVLPSFDAALQRSIVGGDDARTDAPRLALGARVAQAVRVPTLYDLYFSSPQRLFVRALRPERVTLDAEMNVSASSPTRVGVFGATASVARRDTRDAIIWFPGNFGWSPANVGVERLVGGEARVSLEHERLSLSAWTTAYDTELITGALHIPTPYVAQFSGGGQAMLRAGGTTASAVLRASGRRPFTAGPRNPDFELPGNALLDVGLSHRFVVRPFARRQSAATDALVALSLENATDVSWQSVRGFPSPGRAWAVTVTLSPSTNR